jgi:high-affinity iron transporter
MATSAPQTKDITPLGEVVIQYRSYVSGKLKTLATQVSRLRDGLAGADRTPAERRWLAAQVTWQEVGAAYGSLGGFATAISGLASGLQLGPNDPAFTGLHRIEYGLYGGDSLLTVRRYVDQLARDVASLQANINTVEIVPTDMPIRCHEILEDSLRDHLTDQSDYGSGMAYPLTAGDVRGTRVLLGFLKPLFPPAVPGFGLYDQCNTALNALDVALTASKNNGNWPVYTSLSKHQRQPVNGAIGGALEVLYRVPSTLGKLQ